MAMIMHSMVDSDVRIGIGDDGIGIADDDYDEGAVVYGIGVDIGEDRVNTGVADADNGASDSMDANGDGSAKVR